MNLLKSNLEKSILTITVLDSAKNDISVGIDFYEAQNKGLGKYFLGSILSDIESLNVFADLHIIIHDKYRLLSKKFPFAIYYTFVNSHVKIYAILDCRQNPDLLQKRL